MMHNKHPIPGHFDKGASGLVDAAWSELHCAFHDRNALKIMAANVLFQVGPVHDRGTPEKGWPQSQDEVFFVLGRCGKGMI